jgi:hypothetical protein
MCDKELRYKARHPFHPLCNFLDCAWGMGCIGSEQCKHGDPMNKNCSGFELEPTDEEIKAAKEKFGSIPCL